MVAPGNDTWKLYLENTEIGFIFINAFGAACELRLPLHMRAASPSLLRCLVGHRSPTMDSRRAGPQHLVRHPPSMRHT
jgi:hypothetical protein